MTHDFKDAKEWIEGFSPWIHQRWPGDVQHFETVLSALRIAEAVTREPSDEMLKAAINRVTPDWRQKNFYEDIFKAMIAKLLEEVEEVK